MAIGQVVVNYCILRHLFFFLLCLLLSHISITVIFTISIISLIIGAISISINLSTHKAYLIFPILLLPKAGTHKQEAAVWFLVSHWG